MAPFGYTEYLQQAIVMSVQQWFCLWCGDDEEQKNNLDMVDQNCNLILEKEETYGSLELIAQPANKT